MLNNTTDTSDTSLLLFDEADLLERFDNDSEFTQSILEESLHEIPRILEELQQICQGGDCACIRNQAHTLKGMAANISTPRLQDVAMRMETAARDEQLTSAVALLAGLEQVAQATVDAILHSPVMSISE
ncbi:MAG TPA: Hpt domain-containing protein [Desulfuromonadales bacterium]|nr:Hpt domain-containing protein [Desulfuromonadales bacterium]